MSSLFLTLEGGEGAGKTTQVPYIQDFLLRRGREVLTTREPGATRLGKEIRHLLLHTEIESIVPLSELFLLMSDRSQHVEQLIRPALAQNKIVISDRFSDSTVAYQGFGRGIDRQLIEQLNTLATGGLTPHITFWLDIGVVEGLDRVNKSTPRPDRMEKMDQTFHQRVREGFHYLWKKFPDRIVRIDASLAPQIVSTQICTYLERFL